MAVLAAATAYDRQRTGAAVRRAAPAGDRAVRRPRDDRHRDRRRDRKGLCRRFDHLVSPARPASAVWWRKRWAQSDAGDARARRQSPAIVDRPPISTRQPSARLRKTAQCRPDSVRAGLCAGAGIPVRISPASSRATCGACSAILPPTRTTFDRLDRHLRAARKSGGGCRAKWRHHHAGGKARRSCLKRIRKSRRPSSSQHPR